MTDDFDPLDFDPIDDLARARGCATVVFLSAFLWCCVGVALVWLVLR